MLFILVPGEHFSVRKATADMVVARVNSLAINVTAMSTILRGDRVAVRHISSQLYLAVSWCVTY